MNQENGTKPAFIAVKVGLIRDFFCVMQVQANISPVFWVRGDPQSTLQNLAIFYPPPFDNTLQGPDPPITITAITLSSYNFDLAAKDYQPLLSIHFANYVILAT